MSTYITKLDGSGHPVAVAQRRLADAARQMGILPVSLYF